MDVTMVCVAATNCSIMRSIGVNTGGVVVLTVCTVKGVDGAGVVVVAVLKVGAAVVIAVL